MPGLADLLDADAARRPSRRPAARRTMVKQ